jgi:hypothetical protein
MEERRDPRDLAPLACETDKIDARARAGRAVLPRSRPTYDGTVFGTAPPTR